MKNGSEQIKVVVLLATYNGEKYIKEQIESIYNQSFQGEIVVYIRDDGSVDNTQKVVESVDNTPTRRCVFYAESNIGPQRSFLKLIQDAENADYYFFADQDDIWKNDKIERAVELLENSVHSKYKVYCSDYSLTNESMEILQESNVSIEKTTFHVLRLFFYNVFPGCTMAFNHEIREFVKAMNLDNCMMHDSLVLGVAACIGELVYDETPTIYHRIHGNNVVGHGHKKIHIGKWIKEKLQLLIKKDEYDMSHIADRILQVGKGEIIQYKADLELLRDFKKSYKKTFELLAHPDTKDEWNRTTLSIRCKILFHVF